MANIYLIRHGFTPANNANYNCQRGNREIAEDRDMPLERNYGVRQAEEAGIFLNNLIFFGKYSRITTIFHNKFIIFLTYNYSNSFVLLYIW